VRLSHNGEGVKDLDTLIPEFRAWTPDINVSIHFNSVADNADPNKAQGVETYYSYAQSKLLAQTMLDSFSELTGIVKRTSKGGYYKVSRFTDFPSILFETAFICNPNEYEWFMQSENMDTAASAIVAGIVAYFTKLSK
jgi:N-acetylmuramoyl-L-alanine amidase